MTRERLLDLLAATVGYICEVLGDDNNAYHVLTACLGFTDKELKILGIELNPTINE